MEQIPFSIYVPGNTIKPNHIQKMKSERVIHFKNLG